VNNQSKKYDAHGHVKWIGETELKGAKQFPVRKFRIDTDGGRYSQVLEFEVTSDRCSELDSLKVGEPVLVFFNLSGREWSRNPDDHPKVFMSLKAWKIDKTEHPGDRDERLQRDAYAKASHYNHAGVELDERGEAFDDSDIPF
jgi:hypothetical protein